MGIIKAVNLVFDYIRRDEQENVESVNRALDHVNIDIKEGDFVAILGHNGSGKSTFAKHVNGLLLPEEGTVWVSEYGHVEGTEPLACAAGRRDGVPEPRQPDYRKCGRGGRGLRPGEHRRSPRRRSGSGWMRAWRPCT